MRLALAAFLLGLLLGYLGSRYGPLAPNVKAIVDTQTVIVHSVDSSEAVRRDFDAEAKRRIDGLRVAAGTAQFLAKEAGQRADSMRHVLDTASLTINELRAMAQRQDSARLAQLVLERAVGDSLRLALSHAEERWHTADSAARSLTNALHDALRRLELVAKQVRGRCGLGLSAGWALRGWEPDLLGGVSCRL